MANGSEQLVISNPSKQRAVKLLPEVYARHLEEFASLWQQRLSALRSPDYRIGDVNRLEERIHAHFDALVLPGEAAIGALEERLAGDDPWSIFASAYVLLQIKRPAAAQKVLDAFLKAEPEKLEGFRQALCHGPIELIGEQLRTSASVLADPQTPLAAVALEALAVHGRATASAEQLGAILQHESPLVRRIGWRIMAIQEPATGKK